MPLGFNAILSAASISPADVRLLRHQDNKGATRTLYDLWINDRDLFEAYQARQVIANGPKLKAKYWAAFVVTPEDKTVFAGLYSVGARTQLPTDMPRHNGPGFDSAASHETYETTLLPDLADLAGRLVISWGLGWRSWVQRADNQNKDVLEILPTGAELPFPGYLSLVCLLTDVNTMPSSWRQALSLARGIYLLACPESREQYVGMAVGENGFLGRWLEYAATGHGGNIGLLSRSPQDYQVSILEVAGSGATIGDIVTMEVLWKRKLMSREMGLNRN